MSSQRERVIGWAAGAPVPSVAASVRAPPGIADAVHSRAVAVKSAIGEGMGRARPRGFTEVPTSVRLGP
jgi:hypothetical protein